MYVKNTFESVQPLFIMFTNPRHALGPGAAPDVIVPAISALSFCVECCNAVLGATGLVYPDGVELLTSTLR